MIDYENKSKKVKLYLQEQIEHDNIFIEKKEQISHSLNNFTNPENKTHNIAWAFRVLFNNLLFIGGFFENQVITHLDFQKIIKLDKSIFINLIQECSNPINSIFSIKSLIDLESFACIQKCLLKVLNTHKNILKLS